MNDQNIHVGLEISDHEIRIAVGQFYNTRLNILKVERVSCSGIAGTRIVDQNAVIASLRSALSHVQDTLGVRPLRVILALPSVNTRRYTRRIDVSVEERVALKDIQRGLREALNTSLPENEELINLSITKSLVNGITMRRLPLGEACESFSMDVDLLCADRDLVYRYAQTVEKAGLEIAEISLDSFAFGKEASLFEKSMEQYIVALKIERQVTTLSLFAKGKLMSSEVLDLGSRQLIGELAERKRLPVDVADRLIHYNLRLGLDHYPTSPIYLWSNESKTHTLSEAEIAEIIAQPLNAWIDAIKSAVTPILESSKARLVLYGESAEINGLDRLLAKTCDCETELYLPATLGIRSPSLGAVSGLFYVMKDQSNLRSYLPGVDMAEFSSLISPEIPTQSDDTLSGKLKGLFEKRP